MNLNTTKYIRFKYRSKLLLITTTITIILRMILVIIMIIIITVIIISYEVLNSGFTTNLFIYAFLNHSVYILLISKISRTEKIRFHKPKYFTNKYYDFVLFENIFWICLISLYKAYSDIYIYIVNL